MIYQIRLIFLTLGLAIFYMGYFPVKPLGEDVEPPDPPPPWQRRVGQLVVVLVDALRADFVFKIEGEQNNQLPKINYLTDLLISGEGGFGAVMRASPPTVTLPRIKAMLTGSVPAYLDVINNINSDTLQQDSLLNQWNQAGLKMLMFGDETWSRISPVRFLREDPTSSFFVADYTEVDENVTRHLDEELVRDDWDVMILHYLGLDHIGHLEGPYSSLVPKKLEEMGEIIQKIHQRLSSKSDLPPAVLVLGDHGMADGGGHGGASEPEILVPFILLSTAFNSSDQKEESRLPEYLQIDIAPSLAFLSGVNIPRSSYGLVIPELLSILSTQDRIQALLYNANQLAGLAPAGSRGNQLLQDARHLLNTSARLEDVEEMLMSSLKEMQNSLVANVASFDLYILAVAVIMIFSSALITPSMLMNPLRLFLALNITMAAHCLICSAVSSSLCSMNAVNAMLLVLQAMVISCSTAVMLVKNELRHFFSHPNIPFILLHAVSLLSSSFIEEEHQTFYFFTVTILCINLFSNLKNRKYDILLYDAAGLLLHRVLRNFHQTGDKWRHLPDIADYLNMKDLEVHRFCLFAASVFIILSLSDRKYLNICLNIIISVLCIYQKYSNSVTAAQVMYLLLMTKLLMLRSRNSFFETIVYLCCLLHSEVGVICTALYFVLLNCLHHSSKINEDFAVLVCILSKCSLFYYGNSNSLSTINVGAGYTGLYGYNPVLVTVLLAVHTFTGPLVTFSYFLQYMRMNQVLKVYWTITWIDLTLFSILCVLMRYHIFVWTVFSPKLLYFGMELVVINFFVLLHTLYSMIAFE